MNASEINSCYYAKIKAEPDALLFYLSELKDQADDWEDHFGFGAIELDPALIQSDSALHVIHNVQPIDRLGLLRIAPNTFYEWHTDTHRESCVNMLVSQNHHSHTLFGRQVDELNREVVELQYEPFSLYLFNNQAEHCVLNLDGPRYLFSLYFQEETPYKTVRERLKKAKLLSL
jgi:hypothetical protein